MIFSLLPATAAFAQANATARLTNNQVVFPGDTSYSIEVTNNELPLLGRSINAVTIHLPTASANVVFRGKPPAAGAFTNVQAINAGTSQFVTFRGGTIAPGGTQIFTIPATVQRPARSDLSGNWLVQVSSNNMNSASQANPPSGGTLTTAVEVLEILPNTLRAVAPTNADNSKGVTDGTGTAGQTITYSYDVRNYARESLTVTGALSSNGAGDSVGAAQSKPIAGNDGVSAFSIPLTLGPATAQRQSTVTATAVSPNAGALTKNHTFTVQVPVDLAFTNLQPTRVRSGLGSAREFTVTTAKSGGPGFDLTHSALQFGSNSAGLKDAPVRFESGARTATLAYQIAEIAGSDGNVGASISNVGSDDNLASYNLTKGVGTITIDNIVPTFELDPAALGTDGNDAEGDALIAATDGTRITVSGDAEGTDLVGNTLRVSLQPDVGPAIDVPVSQTPHQDGIGFTGSVSGAAVDWVDGATRFVVVAEIEDQAGNIGRAQSSFTVIDLQRPVLDADSGVVQGVRTIRVQFDDATGVRGACDTALWRVNGAPGRVTEVRTSDNTVCSGSSESARAAARRLSTDGVRILITNFDLGPDDTPPVTYSPGLNNAASRQLGLYLAKDGAANDATEQTISTVTDLIPPAPDVLNLRRLDHQTGAREAAYFDGEEQRWYTNVGGADAFVAQVTGVRDGYSIEVLDGNGNVLRTEEAQSPSPLPLESEWVQDVTIPLGGADGGYARGVRLVSSVGKASLATVVNLVLDTARPGIGESALSGPGEALGYFDEKVVNGSDNNSDWFVRWTLVNEGQTQTVRTNVLDIDPVEGATLTTRRAVFSGIDESTFTGLDYAVLHPETVRYEDRAGNYMADTFSFETVE